ncbi:Alpha/Beta hydrolase protein [Thermothelomyces heterothallicus CBS 202.75]|uniref:Alpha/Beta hydrolase protein n=1 Tax=Thermothelomyces heterothallicus CBS 202.75 TaxID=1149848 RepID=UPI0037448164
MFRFFKSDFYNFEATRILSSASAEGCEIAEFVEAVSKIREHDPESWYDAWHEQSQRAEAISRDAIRAGHVDAARKALLRASNYARASGYMLPWAGQDERVLQTAERSISLFRAAIPYMDCRVMVLEIPYQDGILMPAYLYLPPAAGRQVGGGGGGGGGPGTEDSPVPVIVVPGGADATQEELYFVFVSTGVSLGYAVVTFDGPGQGLVLKKHRVVMRPDFEAVTGTVLDHVQHMAAANPDLGLDMDRVGILGASMGAYYALRSSVDPRVRACVSIDPFYGLWRLARTRMPSWYAGLWTSGWLPDSVLNASIYLQMRLHFPTRWEFQLGMAMMGTATPADTLRRFRDFDLDVAPDGKGPIVDRIRCPVLLTGASRSVYASAGESTIAIYNALSGVSESQKEVWIPEEIGNGGMTAKVGAWGLLSHKIFRFFDKWLHVSRDKTEGNGHVCI